MQPENLFFLPAFFLQKLMEIERLKGQQKAGKHLEINQLEKIKKEDILLKEMRDLAL